MEIQCRPCMQNRELYCTMYNRNIEYDQQVRIMYLEVCDILASEDDWLCRSCYMELSAAYGFKKDYFATQLKIQARLQQEKTKTSQEANEPSTSGTSQIDAEATTSSANKRENLTLHCDKCDYVTASKSHLKNHMSRHGNVKVYQCNECGMETRRKCNLTRHLMNHTRGKKYQCDTCDYKTERKNRIVKHMIVKHGQTKPVGVELHSCDQCDFVANQKWEIAQHAHKHETFNRYRCNECDYGAHFKSYLDRHMVTHTGVKRYGCGKCEYKTDRRSRLAEHTLNHDGVKLYACDKCDYATNYKWELIRHAPKHDAVMRFRCDECEYATHLKSNLKRHVLVHAREQSEGGDI